MRYGAGATRQLDERMLIGIQKHICEESFDVKFQQLLAIDAGTRFTFSSNNCACNVYRFFLSISLCRMCSALTYSLLIFLRVYFKNHSYSLSFTSFSPSPHLRLPFNAISMLLTMCIYDFFNA